MICVSSLIERLQIGTVENAEYYLLQPAELFLVSTTFEATVSQQLTILVQKKYK